MNEIDKVREFFKGDLYATSATGIEISEIGDRWAKCTLTLDSRHKNAAGQVMGGVIFTLADFTFAVATNREGQVTVTTSSQISYLNAVKGDVLICEAKLLRDGKKNCFYRIDIMDDAGTYVATVSNVGTHV